jgi:hypothetical protein
MRVVLQYPGGALSHILVSDQERWKHLPGAAIYCDINLMKKVAKKVTSDGTTTFRYDEGETVTNPELLKTNCDESDNGSFEITRLDAVPDFLFQILLIQHVPGPWLPPYVGQYLQQKIQARGFLVPSKHITMHIEHTSLNMPKMNNTHEGGYTARFHYHNAYKPIINNRLESDLEQICSFQREFGKVMMMMIVSIHRL